MLPKHNKTIKVLFSRTSRFMVRNTFSRGTGRKMTSYTNNWAKKKAVLLKHGSIYIQWEIDLNYAIQQWWTFKILSSGNFPELNKYMRNDIMTAKIKINDIFFLCVCRSKSNSFLSSVQFWK